MASPLQHVHTDTVIQNALVGALEQHRIRPPSGPSLKNLVDAFTSRLLDAGVDSDLLDDAFEDATCEPVER